MGTRMKRDRLAVDNYRFWAWLSDHVDRFD